MKIIFIVIVILLISQIAAQRETSIMVHGSPATFHSLRKYSVSLEIKKEYTFSKDKHFCGGTFIGVNKILTVAHCVLNPIRFVFRPRDRFLNPKYIKVLGGITNRKTERYKAIEFDVKYVVGHIDALRNGFENDIAILTIYDEVRKYILPIGIISLQTERPAFGTNCTVLGWGLTSYGGKNLSQELLFIDVTIKTNSQCYAIYGYGIFSSGMLCAGNSEDNKKSPCNGDSGGPMICNDKLVGMTSAGKKCGSKGHPAIYTDVAEFNSWILNHWNSTESNEPKNFIFSFKLFAFTLIIGNWYVLCFFQNLIRKMQIF